MGKYILCNGNKISNIKSYYCEVKGNLGTINIAESCASCSKSSACKKCYGFVIEIRTKCKNINTGRVEQQYYFYRDTFVQKPDEIIKNFEATDFLEKHVKLYSEIIPKYNAQGGSINYPLTYGMFPKDAKSACIECKMQCKKENILPQCQDTELNISQGKLPNLCEKQKPRIMKLY